MISILIPVFNQDVTQLVTTLSHQLYALNRGGEIIVMDDGSDKAFITVNHAIAALPLTQYIINDNNQGRAAIRHSLARTARYEWLLFLDGDSRIISDQYLAAYISRLGNHIPAVIVGGRIYDAMPPTDCALHLHWKYGTARESPAIEQRNQRPYTGFMSNNFLIHASLFKKLSFAGGWQGYGHEDTWIGIQLEENKARVNYIDNAVVHDGLERTAVFMAKSENALHNLLRLSSMAPADKLKRHVKIYRVYCRLVSLKMTWLPVWLYGSMKDRINRNLYSCRPSLRLFDLYRLQYFIGINAPRSG